MHALVGLPAAGKTTLARLLASECDAVRFTLDEWMLRLYGLSFDDEDYVRRLPICLDLIHEIAGDVLRAGVDVVLDWNHWSREKREASAVWAHQRNADFLVHYVSADVTTAQAQLADRRGRREPGSHDFSAGDLAAALAHLVPPSEDEGNAIRVHQR